MHWLALQWLRPDAPAQAGATDMPLSQRATGAPGAQAPRPSAQGPLPVASPLSPDALAWWALGFTPHVAWVDEGLLLEVSACERLWGGRRALLRQVWASQPADGAVHGAQGPTSLVALARLRLKGLAADSERRPAGGAAATPHAPPRAADLPLHTLSAARPHLAVLGQLGCRRWGDLAALPRAGLARRFGPALGRALDVALGRAPDSLAWITPPDTFEQTIELPERADTAPALLWSARRLLETLQHWLAARHQGVRALELTWRFDQRRLNGQELPPQQSVLLRTAEPVQATAHLQRLLAERLARTAMLAPARSLCLRAIDTAPWQAETSSFLPEDQPRGDPWHVFIERVSARLGAHNVRVPVAQADHRPEGRQHWQNAEQTLRRPPASTRRAARANPAAPGTQAAPQGIRMNPATTSATPAASTARQLPDALSPTWLLRPPQPLATAPDQQPLYHGQPLRLISGPQRVEASWWLGADTEAEPPLSAEESLIAGRGESSGPASDQDTKPRTAGERVGAEATARPREGGTTPAPGMSRGPSLDRGSGPCEAGERGGPSAAARPPGGGSAPAPGMSRGPSLDWGSAPCGAGERGGPSAAARPPEGGAAPTGGSATGAAVERGGPISRDYFIAQSATAELLWIYRERPTHAQPGAAGAAPRWFLHGLYA